MEDGKEEMQDGYCNEHSHATGYINTVYKFLELASREL
jgi:hypothetical protein